MNTFRDLFFLGSLVRVRVRVSPNLNPHPRPGVPPTLGVWALAGPSFPTWASNDPYGTPVRRNLTDPLDHESVGKIVSYGDSKTKSLKIYKNTLLYGPKEPLRPASCILHPAELSSLSPRAPWLIP